MTQQIEVAAAHQFQAAAAQPDGPITYIVRFPARTSRNACFADQALCDDAIRMAGKASIKRPENKPEPQPLPQRQTMRRPAASASAGQLPQAQRRFGTRSEIVVERNDSGRRRRGVGAVDEENRQTISTAINEPVFAIGGVTRKCRRQRSDRAGPEHPGRGGDHHGGRVEMRQPNERCATCR